jgi:hypothetical protein
MGGGGGIGEVLKRVVADVGTAGAAELTRKKPFQPGGDTKAVDVAAGAAGGLGLGSGGGATLVGAGAALNALSPTIPPLPASPTASSVETAAQDAANAVQTADAEARRARSAKRQSSVLGNYQGFSATGISPATLQPAQPRKSVLG